MTDGIEHENTIEVELTTMLTTILKQEEIMALPIKIDFKEGNTMKRKSYWHLSDYSQI